MIQLKPIYKKLKESNTTGSGTTGATFTPGVGEQYATSKAFKKKKKKFKVTGYKDFNPKVRFKAKTFDVANWASNSPKYLREIKIIPSSNLPENVKEAATQLIYNSGKELVKFYNIIVNIKLGSILSDSDLFKETKLSLENLQRKFEILRKKVENIADDYSANDDFSSYSEWMEVDNELQKQEDKIEALIFIIELFEEINQDFEDAEHHKKSFYKI